MRNAACTRWCHAGVYGRCPSGDARCFYRPETGAWAFWHDPGMTQMTMGGNIPLTATLVRAVLQWSGDPGVPDVDVSALLLDDTGEVASDADFVFYNQPEHYSGAIRLAGKTPGAQASDVIDVNLASVPASVQR